MVLHKNVSSIIFSYTCHFFLYLFIVILLFPYDCFKSLKIFQFFPRARFIFLLSLGFPLFLLFFSNTLPCKSSFFCVSRIFKNTVPCNGFVRNWWAFHLTYPFLISLATTKLRTFKYLVLFELTFLIYSILLFNRVCSQLWCLGTLRLSSICQTLYAKFLDEFV